MLNPLKWFTANKAPVQAPAAAPPDAPQGQTAAATLPAAAARAGGNPDPTSLQYAHFKDAFGGPTVENTIGVNSRAPHDEAKADTVEAGDPNWQQPIADLLRDQAANDIAMFHTPGAAAAPINAMVMADHIDHTVGEMYYMLFQIRDLLDEIRKAEDARDLLPVLQNLKKRFYAMGGALLLGYGISSAVLVAESFDALVFRPWFKHAARVASLNVADATLAAMAVAASASVIVTSSLLGMQMFAVLVSRGRVGPLGRYGFLVAHVAWFGAVCWLRANAGWAFMAGPLGLTELVLGLFCSLGMTVTADALARAADIADARAKADGHVATLQQRWTTWVGQANEHKQTAAQLLGVLYTMETSDLMLKRRLAWAQTSAMLGYLRGCQELQRLLNQPILPQSGAKPADVTPNVAQKKAA